MMLDTTSAVCARLIGVAVALLCFCLGAPWWLLIVLIVGIGIVLPFALVFVVWLMRR